jgi:hypothetical protein
MQPLPTSRLREVFVIEAPDREALALIPNVGDYVSAGIDCDAMGRSSISVRSSLSSLPRIRTTVYLWVIMKVVIEHAQGHWVCY